MSALVDLNLYRRRLLEHESDDAGWISLADAVAAVLSKLRIHMSEPPDLAFRLFHRERKTNVRPSKS
jgi:hypothetical protein